MSISKSTYLFLFLISEIFTQTVTQNTCAYTNSAIHPKQPSECLYQPAENGVCCYVTTTSDENWCLDLPIEKGKQIDTTSATYSFIKTYTCPTPSKVVNNPYTYKTWSEMVVAPDNIHVAWTSLNFACG